MIEIPSFGLYEYIATTNSLFEGCLNMVGEKCANEEKYRLVNSRVLTEYVSKARKGESPSFTSNDFSGYLNRCRYFIYQEKRTTTEKQITEKGEKKTIEVKIETDSSEVFSQKTVRLFFELSGVNFYFLRLMPIAENAQESDRAFRELQENCLEHLFTFTLHYLYDSLDKEYNMTLLELTKLWKLLYRIYRFKLLAYNNAKLLSPQEFFFNEELLHQVDTLTAAYQNMRRLSGLYHEPDEDAFDGPTNYIVGGDEKILHLKKGYEIEPVRTQKLLKYIRCILDAKEYREIEQKFNRFIPKDEAQGFKANTKASSKSVYWKQWLINQIIEIFFQQRKYSVFASVLYLQNFEEAIQVYREICNKMWEMVFSVLKMVFSVLEFDNIEVVDYLMEGNINKLICELDETLWFLCYHNGNLYNE